MRGLSNPAGANRRGERGQTILLVAISIISLLAMAALAIDVVSLYVASTEIQRSADAAALAGAKAMADSGITTLQSGDGNVGAGEALAQNMATQAIAGIISAASVNQVAGGSPVQLAGSPSFNWAQGNGNPQVTVTLQQTNLPTFFARVFGSRASTATATATAEAYNPANQQSFTPIQTTCVKPWLIANQDPNQLPANVNLVNVATGQVEDPAVLGSSFWLSSDCNGGDSCSNLKVNPLGAAKSPSGKPFLYLVPALVTSNTGDVCSPSTTPPCGGGNHPTYKAAEECCSVTPYTCGGSVPNANGDATLNPEFQGANSDLALGTQCLIHASGASTGQGQDSLDWAIAPFPTGPPRITAGSGPLQNKLVSTSSSIATIPIIDTSSSLVTTPPFSVTVVGFLQAFIDQTDMGPADPGHRGDVNITVLNVIGCSQTPNANTPVVGGVGASPVPVRLITPQ